jgi:hypothetical protein
MTDDRTSHRSEFQFKRLVAILSGRLFSSLVGYYEFKGLIFENTIS